MNVPTCNWPGASRATYTYGIYKMDGDWNLVPGNYIFAKETSPGVWEALYVGQTESFRARITPNHEEWERAIRLGATHIHARVNQAGKTARLEEESDLIRSLNPPLNQKVSLGPNPLFAR